MIFPWAKPSVGKFYGVKRYPYISFCGEAVKLINKCFEAFREGVNWIFICDHAVSLKIYVAKTFPDQKIW